MKSYGCNFCNDLRNIQPAKYVALATDDVGDDEFRKVLNKAKEEKSFLLFKNNAVYIVDKCPFCGYKFTEEDYNSYD